MVRVVYDPVIGLFYGFESLVSNFVNDRIRSSILLSLGEITGKLSDLEARYSGWKVFYAVSPSGRVIMKPAAGMTGEKKALVEVKKRSNDKFTVSVDKINLK